MTLTYAEWTEALREDRLLGLACSCGHTNGTPTGACPHCGNRDLERVELPMTGVVHTETTIQVPPAGVAERGYQVGVVELGDARVMGRFGDEHAAIGDEVALAGVVEGDDGHPGPLFERV
ncbi:Zn-ribbon domain-containing OB-fold protein [Halosegnis marinus]|uniref:Zn-ribbon domain-containing OB-fold protein n=1 Tax=Halosegnis marinus TaxID=3034023 RepID=A0ABD5ZKF7_9EURY|nr:zinc ribbon domain-containing protein [Halosegnis sp. DT85]